MGQGAQKDCLCMGAMDIPTQPPSHSNSPTMNRTVLLCISAL